MGEAGRSYAAALTVLAVLAGSAEANWLPLSGNGRGCCADASGAVTRSLASFDGVGSVGACRRQCVESCVTIEYDKDTEVCRSFAAGTVSTVLLNYYDCTAVKRCQTFVSEPPTSSPSEAPIVGPPGQGTGTGGENREGEGSEEESNYSVQGGDFDYLASFYALHRPPFGILAGRAGLVRTAVGASKISAAFKLGLSLDVDGLGLDDLAAATFPIKLHSDLCSVGGGLPYQNPYICSSQAGGRCSDIQVAAAARGGSPVEVQIDATVNTGGNMESIVEMVWPVHIPERFSGQSRHSLSMIIYDPVSGAAMACADLEDDRLMDGLMYYINSQDVPFVPVVTESHLTRTERGATELYMAMLNLPSDRTFRARVHSTACVPLPGLTAAQQLQARGGEPYMREIACYGQVGTDGCEASEANSMTIEFQGAGQFSASTAHESFPLVARADAVSIALNICDESGCASGETLLICVDLQNDIAEIITTSSMMSHTTGLADTTEDWRVYTADPSPAPTSSSPTTDAPTTGTPTTFGPTPSPTSPPGTSGPTPAPSTVGPTPAPSTVGPTPAPSTVGPTPSPSRRPTTDNPTPAPSGSPVGKVAASLSPQQSPTSSPSGGGTDVLEPGDREDGGGSGNPGVRGKTPGVHWPCPKLASHFRELLRRQRQVGKKKGHGTHHDLQLQAIMLSAEEQECCLDLIPPQGLLSFEITETDAATSVAISISIIAAVTGAVFIMAGAVFATYRRYVPHGTHYDLLDAGYAIPESEPMSTPSPEADPDDSFQYASVLNHIELTKSEGSSSRVQLTPTKNSMRLD